MTEAPNLSARRKALGLSQEQLSHLLGLTQGTISRNETAERPDMRYALSLDALAARKAAGEDLIATAAKLASARAAA